MFPVLVQRIRHIDLRYVQDDGQEPTSFFDRSGFRQLSHGQRDRIARLRRVTKEQCRVLHLLSCSTLPHMPISAVSCRKVASCEILYSYTTMVACVHTRAQLLILFSCTYISLTVIAHQCGPGDKKSMCIRVDQGTYHSAFKVLDTTRFDNVGLFQDALRDCLDTTRERLKAQRKRVTRVGSPCSPVFPNISCLRRTVPL